MLASITRRRTPVHPAFDTGDPPTPVRSLKACDTPLRKGIRHLPAMTAAPPRHAASERSDRIPSLDILRGLALFGMLIVHFHDHAAGGEGLTERLIELLVSERAYATFAFLFGAGFAVQLHRARERGSSFTGLYLRRLAGLAAFGVVAHGVFGFPVLLGYALWGLVLLPLERLPFRALVVLAVIATFSRTGYSVVRGVTEARTLTTEEVAVKRAAERQRFVSAWEEIEAARDQPTLAAAIPFRVRHMAWFYRQPFFLYFPSELPLFLWGLLAVRLGVLEQPRRHGGLIAAAATVGIVGWAAAEWLLPMIPRFQPLWLSGALQRLPLGIWLMFFYVGATLLLLAHAPRVAHWLGWFAWPGRAALTSYFIQIVLIDLAVSRYGLGLGTFPAWIVLPAAVAAFGALMVASRWWFTRYRFGPLEWVWRWMTQGRRPPFRQPLPAVPLPVPGVSS